MNKQKLKDALKAFFIKQGFDTSGDVRICIDPRGDIAYQGFAKKLPEKKPSEVLPDTEFGENKDD